MVLAVSRAGGRHAWMEAECSTSVCRFLVHMALTLSRAGLRNVCTGAEYCISVCCGVITMALALSRAGLRNVCTEAEYSTSIRCLVVHMAAAASCGGASLERKERDETFKVLQRCTAEMWSPLEEPHDLSPVQRDDGSTSIMHPYASILRALLPG